MISQGNNLTSHSQNKPSLILLSALFSAVDTAFAQENKSETNKFVDPCEDKILL